MAESGPGPVIEVAAGTRVARPARLLAELRRRGVVRAVAGYSVAAFAILQVTEPILHALALPDGWLTGVVVLLALGFPLVAAVSWAFDLTARGLVRTEEVEPVAPAPSAPARAVTSRAALASALVASTFLGAALAWLALRAPAWQPVADADGRISVAVADFANQTGEPPLDALSGLLITSLEQSRRLKVLTRGRMFELLKQAGQERVDRIDEPMARQVGMASGVRALLLASVVRLGGAYVVELRALDPVKDHYLFSLREQAADQAGLLPLVDRLSDGVRRRLREAEGEVRSADIQVAQAITPNLEAYRHYFKGRELRVRLDDAAARVEFEKALAIEPRFALAQLELGLISALWVTGETERLFREAAANASRLPEKEREIVLAHADVLDGRDLEAAGRTRRLADRYPEESEVVFHAAQMALDPDDQLELFRRLVRLAPDHEQAWSYLALVATPRGRAGEVLSDALAAERARPTAGMATAVGMARLGTGAAAGAADDFRRALERGGTTLAPIGLAFARLDAGEAQAVRAHLEAIPDGVGREDDTVGREFGLATVEAMEGKLKAASARLERIGRAEGLRGMPWRQLRTCFHVAAGDLPTARRLAGQQVDELIADSCWYLAAGEGPRRAAQARLGTDGPVGRWTRALTLRERGDLPGAVAALGPLDPRECGRRAWLLGMLEAERGRHAEAAALLGRLEPCLTIGMGGAVDLWLHASARIRRAASLGASGQADAGRALIERQLRAWRAADPDLPLLVEARAVCRTLGCQAP